ncbi:MAG: mechanosensitive ion channel family protein [Solirubrobacterales bacterium]
MEQTFWQAHGNQVSAAITMLVAMLIAVIVDRLLFGSAEKAASKVDTEVFSREARTRLRLFRRLLFVVIIAIGVALALSQFAEIKRLATGLLASTAVLGLVVGFAGRQVIANAVAGVIVAVTQPVRIGDLVTIEDRDGRVADITLTYTEIDTEDGRRVVVPNERLTTNVVVNRSAGSARAPAVITVGAPPGMDVEAARKAIEAAGARSVVLTELNHDSARLEVKAERDIGKARGDQESELRETVQSALRQAGLLAGPTG